MTTESLLLERGAIQGVFDVWTATDDSLDAQLNESLSALAAYQRHLDEWQRQLVEERSELQQDREQWERDRAADDPSGATAEVVAELAALREKNSSLTSNLLERTEELRALEQRRGELMMELETVCSQKSELKAALDEQKRAWDEERMKWAEEVRVLRDKLETQTRTAAAAQSEAVSQRTAADPPPAPAVQRETAASGAVLGSIVEQFGKLRLQRANERQSSKKTR